MEAGGASPAGAGPGREALAQGWLRKMGRRPGAGWAPRFCILHGPRLDYYAQAGASGLRGLLGWARPDAALVDVELRGSLLIGPGASVAEEGPGTAAGGGAFRLMDARGKETVFQGVNAGDTARWLGLVRRAIAERREGPGGRGWRGAEGRGGHGGLDLDARDAQGCLCFFEALPSAGRALKTLDAALSELRTSGDLPGPGDAGGAPEEVQAQEALMERCCRRLGETAGAFFSDLAASGGALHPGALGSAREQQLRRVAQNVTLLKAHDALFAFVRRLNAERDRQLAGIVRGFSGSEALAALLASPRVAELRARGGPALESLRAGSTPYEKAMALKDATAAIVDAFDSEQRGASRAGTGASTDDILSRLVLLLTAVPVPDLCTHAAFMERFVDVCDGDSLKGELGYHITNLLVACEFILHATPASFLEQFQLAGEGGSPLSAARGVGAGEADAALPGRGGSAGSARASETTAAEAAAAGSPAKSPFRRSVPALAE